MKHLVLYETYMDIIGDPGSFHDVFSIDDDWILKMPKKAEIGETVYILQDFEEHINTMKKYPLVFPKVKKLNKYRAAVEKLDTNSAKKEISHIYNKFVDSYTNYYTKEEGIVSPEFKNRLSEKDIIADCYYDKAALLVLESMKDIICQKWILFIKLLKSIFSNENNYLYLDLHSGNFGIDKQGNIKLLDF